MELPQDATSAGSGIDGGRNGHGRFFLKLIPGCVFSRFSSLDISGQILAASHGLNPKCSWGRKIPLFQEYLGW